MMVVDGHCWSPVRATRAGQKTMSKAGKNELSFMDDKFVDELIQDSATKKNCKKSGTESADKKERKIGREK